MHATSLAFSLASAAAIAATTGLRAQDSVAVAGGGSLDAIASWIALPASPGRERAATDAIVRAEPAWHRDAIGNLVLQRGRGRPRRVIACGLDEPGYAVSEITSDGYLRVQYAGNARRHPLWDQFNEGQRMRILTSGGALPGVMGVRSVHLSRGRDARDAPVSIDDLWLDIGARSRAEASALGVALLDPVERDWPHWTYADQVAGPNAADRTGCAAVAAAASNTPATGETVYVLSVQSSFGWAGLAYAVKQAGIVDTLVVASTRFFPQTTAAEGAGVQRRAIRAPVAARANIVVPATLALTVRPRFRGSFVESVRASDAASYLDQVADAAGIAPAKRSALAFMPVGDAMRAVPARTQPSLRAAATVLATFADRYAVSGHESAMRSAVRAQLPAWARSRVREDSAGNLVLALGPDRDTVVFMAHMDEIGFEITRIAPDGTVELRQRGGFYRSLWEGETALLHLDSADLRGVFIPRDSASIREPGTLSAWFGMDSATLAARGATVGSSLTSLKRATPLGPTRFTARSLDDRTGCSAFILALRAINPDRLTHKVIFIFSVREETGLDGAAAAANELTGPVRRVYAVDTFVSSDSPLESHRFAFAPLGNGAVARALDNSSSTPPGEIARVVAAARAAGIALQVGTTNGGNDGSEFVPHGVVDVPLSWPLRYSHSPAEVDDLRDLVSLGRLIATLATH